MCGVLEDVMTRIEDLEASLGWYGTHLNCEGKGRGEGDTFTNV